MAGSGKYGSATIASRNGVPAAIIPPPNRTMSGSIVCIRFVAPTARYFAVSDMRRCASAFAPPRWPPPWIILDGASPALEIVYLWNGTKRMGADLSERALRNAAWDRCTAPADVVAQMRATPDESAIQALIEASQLRNLGRLDEARRRVEEGVLVHNA